MNSVARMRTTLVRIYKYVCRRRKKLISGANWSDLPPDMLMEIATKLELFEDFMAFRGVCTSWRASAAKDIFKGAKLPLLMLSDYGYRHCRFYGLTTNKIRKAGLPEAKGKRCMDARFGWILAVSRRSGGEVYLFKPFSSLSPTITLPSFPPEYCYLYEPYLLRKAILTANPSETSDFMVVMLMDCKLIYWKNGDNIWSRMVLGQCNNIRFKSIGYCGHKMYAIDEFSNLWSLDPSKTPYAIQCQLVLSLDLVLGSRVNFLDNLYITESTAGELLVVKRPYSRYRYRSISTYFNFRVLRIDVVRRRWEAMKGLGDAIFCSGLGDAVCVAASNFAGFIKPNSLYFKKDGELVLEIFNNINEDTSIQRLHMTKKSCHSFWLFP